MYKNEFNRELILSNLEESLFCRHNDDPTPRDDEMFWDGFDLLPTIITIRPGELFDFRMWNGWVMTEWDRPLEYNHLYDFLRACLKGKPYEIDYQLYAKHYPILFIPIDQ